MSESQSIEYKSSWRDEYLKWICGFANAQGGKLYIGVDDNGYVCGVSNIKRLLEDIPNKLQTSLGIVTEVNKKEKDGLEYIEIIVVPSSFSVSYRGEFHYRSGATKQQLTGIALTEFIAKKTGVRWEDAVVEDIRVEDLDIPNEDLLKKLHLMEGEKLKRSAVLLFYSDPSRVQNGSYVKIGRFGDGADLQYQDTIEDSLIKIADKVIDVIYLKYLKAKITYEHDRRVETYPYARNAIREAVYNAIVHNCYMFGSPVQIRVENESIIVSNRCVLPDGWTAETLMNPHDSIPYNPDIANVFYRAGYIENWGRGIEKICDACRELGADLPKYEIVGNGLRIYFSALKSAMISENEATEGGDVGINVGINEQKVIGLIVENSHISAVEVSEKLSISLRQAERIFARLKEKKLIERVGARKNGYWKVKNATTKT
ncbi:RNA-binding domain-containing protein [Fibrobacter sp.]|uniref:RNA-binding domain-containing protein n=1 Tax=Fibrobacter sp. TaxID=35828 RepID=UPI00262287DB|nr:RNA-binding domain-containing protein [Fibrobacter sp.]MDD5942252.1 putative DNA binding domain-containing protein [Fibrobacter sp.]